MIYVIKSIKFFEVNPRQSRSGYYFCACGHNLVKLLIDDLFYNSLDNNKFELVKNNVVLSFVPKSVIKKYVTSDNLKAEINRELAILLDLFVMLKICHLVEENIFL